LSEEQQAKVAVDTEWAEVDGGGLHQAPEDRLACWLAQSTEVFGGVRRITTFHLSYLRLLPRGGRPHAERHTVPCHPVALPNMMAWL